MWSSVRFVIVLMAIFPQGLAGCARGWLTGCAQGGHQSAALTAVRPSETKVSTQMLRWAREPGVGLSVSELAIETSDLAEALRRRSRRSTDITIAVPADEIRGVIGPNGAGKTTSERVLSGVAGPQRALPAALGVDATGWPAFRVARHAAAWSAPSRPSACSPA